MGLLVVSGYYAGTPIVHLPEESGKHAISTRWMLDNFSKWVEDVPTREIYIIEKIADVFL